MKKLISAIVIFAMVLTVTAISAFAATTDYTPVKSIVGADNNNYSDNNYNNFSRTVKSYMEELSDGYRILYYKNSALNIDDYDSAWNRTSTSSIAKEGWIFGGYYNGTEYNFLVWGQENSAENDSKEVIRIEKYTKDWKSVAGYAQVFGANTTTPFYAGSLRMTETAGKLYIHTCHKMYANKNDGLNHQANMTFVVDISSMTVVDSFYKVMNISYGYASHSFNQFILTDGSYIYRADHGDAYPRSVVITKVAVGDKISKVKYTDALTISGTIGDNFTGVTVGGFEMAGNSLLIAGNTVDQTASNLGYSSPRNIFITVTDKNLSSTKIKYLTNYTDADNVTIHTPHLVKINDNKFLIMWEELVNHDIYTKIATIDADVNLTSDIVDTTMALSDCKPIVLKNGLVCWYVSDTPKTTVYTVDPDDLKSANNGALKAATGFTATATASTVSFSWDINGDATSYTIEEYVNGSWNTVADTSPNTCNSYTVTGLTPTTTHKYRLVSHMQIIDTWVDAITPEISVTTTVPDMTGFGFKSSSSTTIDIGWSKNSYAGGYIIEQKINGTWKAIADIANNNTISHHITGLTSNTAYSYRMRAYYKNGTNTVYSNYTSALSVSTAPAILKNLRVSERTASSLRLVWDIDTVATGYIVEQLTDGKWSQIANITDNKTNFCQITGLNPSTEYRFRIRAYKTAGGYTYYGDYSAQFSSVTSPSAMSKFCLGGRAADVLRLCWKTNPSATGYIIEQKIDDQWLQIAKIENSETNFYRVTGLKSSTTYKFRMRAYNTSGTSTYYGNYTGILTSTTAPSAMSGFGLGGRATDVLRLSWKVNPSATGYIIEQYIDGKWTRIAKITDNKTNYYRVTGLDPSTTYKFRMKAYKMVGKVGLHGKYTGTLTSTTCPSAVTGMKLGGRLSTVLRINWAENTTADGYMIEQYIDGKWAEIAKITDKATTTYRITDLEPMTCYKFRMRSYRIKSGVYLYSKYTSAMSWHTSPSLVENVEINDITDSSIQLCWDRNDTADGYIIEQYKDGAWKRIAKIANKNAVYYNVKNLKSVTTYSFRIKTYKMIGKTGLHGEYVNISATTYQ